MQNTSFVRQGKKVWDTKIYFIYKIAKKMDESKRGKGYDWQVLNSKMESSEKRLLN
jgi:hypothetical protein